MSSRGSIDWPRAVLLSAFDDLLCRVTLLSFFLDVRRIEIARISPIVFMTIPSSSAYDSILAAVSHKSREQALCGHYSYEQLDSARLSAHRTGHSVQRRGSALKSAPPRPMAWKTQCLEVMRSW